MDYQLSSRLSIDPQQKKKKKKANVLLGKLNVLAYWKLVPRSVIGGRGIVRRVKGEKERRA